MPAFGQEYSSCLTPRVQQSHLQQRTLVWSQPCPLPGVGSISPRDEGLFAELLDSFRDLGFLVQGLV